MPTGEGWTVSGARAGEQIALDRPPPGPPPGRRRPWEWLRDLEPDGHPYDQVADGHDLFEADRADQAALLARILGGER